MKINSYHTFYCITSVWLLGTSRVILYSLFSGQTSMLDLKKHPKCVSAGGGFGPVADDGYGVSYIIVGEDLLFFHVSSKKSCPITVRLNRHVNMLFTICFTTFVRSCLVNLEAKKIKNLFVGIIYYLLTFTV